MSVFLLVVILMITLKGICDDVKIRSLEKSLEEMKRGRAC